MIAKAKTKPARTVPLPTKTLTLRLDGRQSALLDEIMARHQVKTASGMLERMLDSWMRLHDELQAARDTTEFYCEAYDDIRGATEQLRGDLKLLLEKVSQPKLNFAGNRKA